MFMLVGERLRTSDENRRCCIHSTLNICMMHCYTELSTYFLIILNMISLLLVNSIPVLGGNPDVETLLVLESDT